LADLFKSGEKPERILGGLRYQLIRHTTNIKDKLKKITLFLEADVNIKTGKLKPEFALEALIIKLCL
jgi:DNA polymerase III delta subunit